MRIGSSNGFRLELRSQVRNVKFEFQPNSLHSPLGKVWIHLSIQVWANNRIDWILLTLVTTTLDQFKENSEFKTGLERVVFRACPRNTPILQLQCMKGHWIQLLQLISG